MSSKFKSAMLHSSSLYVPETKVCSVCKTDKPIKDFYTKSNCGDNHYSECKSCTKKYTSKGYLKKKQERDYMKQFMPI